MTVTQKDEAASQFRCHFLRPAARLPASGFIFLAKTYISAASASPNALGTAWEWAADAACTAA